MVGSFIRLAAAAAFSCLTVACTSMPETSFEAPAQRSASSDHLQCVPYARARSGIKIYGDAYTWWDQAEGKFKKTDAPRLGAVMVLAGYAGPKRAHLAVVSGMKSNEVISVDHANWLNDGAIFTNDPVMDVSDDGDWSEVRVWNPRTGAWGTKQYHVLGFILPGPDDDSYAMN